MRLTKELSRLRWSEIRDLWCEWDPIGVMSHDDWPRDEYDSYLGPTLRLLEADASADEIIKYLAYVEIEYIGLSDTISASIQRQEFAQKLQNWYSTKWHDTVS